ncbi:MAG: hypothetical protein N0E59_08900 [Candidatus Thiodiazotropha taylori]|nr:hypothetical protein [Candidatus Thiodiazotropha taylori]MCG8096100.1 hypothetical protein [Candidatus Thiodiazotropha endolucinida]MCG8106634.1 hypothetical protein [Candidatus Thiodiazotropha taylori]MCG8110868.1 hypothetical protein [Candidatus Thiodiazotropha taylori]MCW4278971.1 hypothetical protein [Candidatus Thiodiazotropha taylori]
MTPEEYVSIRLKDSGQSHLTGQAMQSILNAWLNSLYNTTGTTDYQFSGQALIDLMKSAKRSDKPQGCYRAIN